MEQGYWHSASDMHLKGRKGRKLHLKLSVLTRLVYGLCSLFTPQSHQLSSLGRVACEDCGKEFTDATAFRTHHHSHTHPFKCSGCNHRFQTRVGFGELM